MALQWSPLGECIAQEADVFFGSLSGWWARAHPSEQYEFVNWDDDSQYMGK